MLRFGHRYHITILNFCIAFPFRALLNGITVVHCSWKYVHRLDVLILRLKGIFKTNVIVSQALLAAIYAALTLLVYPIAFGTVQCRISEALTILPFFNPYCTIGLGIGCFIANLIGGNGIFDIVFGTLATVLAGCCTAKIRRDWLAPLPPVLFNMVIVGAVLTYTLTPESFWASFVIFAAEVGLGQLGACYVLGLPLLKLLKRYEKTLKGRFGSWMTKD